MAELLAVPSAVAGLMSLTITVIKLSRGYISSVKTSKKTIQAYFSELELLKAVLLEFNTLAENPETSTFLSGVKAFESDACRQELQSLHEKLLEMRRQQTNALHRHRDSLHALLSTRQCTAILSEVRRLGHAQPEASEQVSYEWLSTANPTLNHKFARRKHSEGTGQWFLQSPTFVSWFTDPCKSLCLHAMPGGGKSVLCSTIIEYVLHNQPNEAIAYFYFDFNDQSKQTLNSCLRSILAQLCIFHTSTPEVVAELRSLSQSPGRNGFLDNEELLLAVISVSSGLNRSRIIIDALDECTERQELTKAIAALAASFAISLLVTSRREHDIVDVLSDALDGTTALDPESVDKDIGAYVDECLRTDPKLKKMPQSVKVRIKDVLTTKAGGMFRWVECQVEVLRFCLNRAAVEKALNSLPSTLDASYDRILLRIHQAQVPLARAALEFAIFCQRPPTLVEMAEAAAVGCYDGPFDGAEQLFEAEQILEMCSSLIVLEQPVSMGSETYDMDLYPESPASDQPIVRLAHYTVREYLLSPRIRAGPASAFAFSEPSGAIAMARICLRYLLFDKPEPITPNIVKEFPLSLYAARYWYKHVTSDVIQQDPITVELLQTFLDNKGQYYFLNSIRLSDPEPPFWSRMHLDLQPDELLSPVYYMCREGVCSEAVKLAIDMGSDVNGRGGDLGFPLQAASSWGFSSVKVLDVLLEANADLNAIGGHYHAALNAAVSSGKDEAVARLLKAGADPNIRLDHDSTVLHSVCTYLAHDPETCRRIIQRLLNAGADVNAVDEYFGSPLATAVRAENFDTVQTLVQAGADVSSRDPSSSTALIKAAEYGHIKILKCLLDAGTDVNIIEGRNYEKKTALAAAAKSGNLETVQLLLRAGADVNTGSDQSMTALMGAAISGNIEILNCFLDTGADINTIGWHFGKKTALAAAAEAGNLETVRILLLAGADVNIGDCQSMTVLMSAAISGNIEILNCLLDAGADVNTIGGPVFEKNTALAAAAQSGNFEAVQLLLRAGADVNIGDRQSMTALMGAAISGNIEILNCLLDAGADVNTIGGNLFEKKTALAAAANKGNLEAVRILLLAGADVNSTAEDCPTALTHAAGSGDIQRLECLLGAGAKVNLRSKDCETPLEAAVEWGNIDIVKRLLETGADVNSTAKHRPTALTHAAGSGDIQCLECLLGAGAKVNLRSKDCETPLEAAVEWENIDIVKRLLEGGAEVNCIGDRSATALVRAVRNEKMDIVDCLLEAGADPGLSDSCHESAFAAAMRLKRFDIYERLMMAAKSDERITRRASCDLEEYRRQRSPSRRRASMLDFDQFADEGSALPFLEERQSVDQEGAQLAS